MVIPIDAIEQFEGKLLERPKAPAVNLLGLQCLKRCFGDLVVTRISLLAKRPLNSMYL